MKLSALVCVQNQEAQLGECLRKLSFCDEIVVVADRCTDRSQEIARRRGAVVVDGIFPLENQRKAAGMEACTGEWILEIDPDELVDAHLAWEIRAALQLRRDGDFYELPIDNYVGEALVREGWTGAFSARREVRLYRRGLKAWAPRRLAGRPVLAGRSGGALKGAVRRALGPDVGALIARLDRLTALQAEDLADTARPPRVAAGVLEGARTFLAAYVVRGGWREGRLGLVAALLAALLPVLSRFRALDVAEARQRAATEAAEPDRLPGVVGFATRWIRPSIADRPGWR